MDSTTVESWPQPVKTLPVTGSDNFLVSKGGNRRSVELGLMLQQVQPGLGGPDSLTSTDYDEEEFEPASMLGEWKEPTAMIKRYVAPSKPLTTSPPEGILHIDDTSHHSSL
eukprot:TRINITY_DN59342_c0_g1_i1.p1 TRINITY_DN59342_c0_g1~~TRINITY_DN59342_c0_g1_i1.p1  ORF type:complete len:111 (+),score=0.75 TRINITY_DN59342_c0_g1_i1:100-432(+)